MDALFSKILCPIDFDRIALAAVELAVKIAKQNEAEVCLLHVSPDSAPETARAAHDQLRGVARSWTEGKVRYELLVRSGAPADAILRAIEEGGADLVVMATHGRTGEKLARLGSVTDQIVRRANCPVITVRPEWTMPKR